MNNPEKLFRTYQATEKALKEAKIALYSNLSFQALREVAKKKGLTCGKRNKTQLIELLINS